MSEQKNEFFNLFRNQSKRRSKQTCQKEFTNSTQWFRIRRSFWRNEMPKGKRFGEITQGWMAPGDSLQLDLKDICISVTTNLEGICWKMSRRIWTKDSVEDSLSRHCKPKKCFGQEVCKGENSTSLKPFH